MNNHYVLNSHGLVSYELFAVPTSVTIHLYANIGDVMIFTKRFMGGVRKVAPVITINEGELCPQFLLNWSLQTGTRYNANGVFPDDGTSDAIFDTLEDSRALSVVNVERCHTIDRVLYAMERMKPFVLHVAACCLMEDKLPPYRDFCSLIGRPMRDIYKDVSHRTVKALRKLKRSEAREAVAAWKLSMRVHERLSVPVSYYFILDVLNGEMPDPY